MPPSGSPSESPSGSLARRAQSLYDPSPMASAIRHVSLSLASPLPATGSLPLGLLLLRLAR